MHGPLIRLGDAKLSHSLQLFELSIVLSLSPGLVSKCWAAKPDDRPSAEEVLRTLHEINAGRYWQAALAFGR